MKRGSAKDTPKSRRESTAAVLGSTGGPEQSADDHFQNEARKRLLEESKKLTGEKAPTLTYTIKIPMHAVFNEITTSMIYGNKRGRPVAFETAAIIRAEVKRLLTEQPGKRPSQRQISQQFSFLGSTPEQRYDRYRTVVKDSHAKIQSILSKLKPYLVN